MDKNDPIKIVSNLEKKVQKSKRMKNLLFILFILVVIHFGNTKKSYEQHKLIEINFNNEKEVLNFLNYFEKGFYLLNI